MESQEYASRFEKPDPRTMMPDAESCNMADGEARTATPFSTRDQIAAMVTLSLRKLCIESVPKRCPSHVFLLDGSDHAFVLTPFKYYSRVHIATVNLSSVCGIDVVKFQFPIRPKSMYSVIKDLPTVQRATDAIDLAIVPAGAATAGDEDELTDIERKRQQVRRLPKRFPMTVTLREIQWNWNVGVLSQATTPLVSELLIKPQRTASKKRKRDPISPFSRPQSESDSPFTRAGKRVYAGLKDVASAVAGDRKKPGWALLKTAMTCLMESAGDLLGRAAELFKAPQSGA